MANTYLNKTFSGSGSLTTWTFSAWIKKCDDAATGTIFAAYTDGSNHDRIIINSNGTLSWYAYTSSSYVGNKNTNRVFKDTNAWYNIVCQWNTTSGTASERMRIWINGEEETSFATDTNPGSSASSNFNNHNRQHVIGSAVGSLSGTAEYFNGVMSHVHFCDGTALAPTVFGSTDSTTGEWKINTAPSFTPGTNGFTILKDGMTITDQSANSNNFTLGGGTLTKTEDCPSNVFAIWNFLANDNGNYALTNGNTSYSNADNNWSHGGLASTIAIMPASGKYYWEHKKTYAGNHIIFGLIIEDEVYRLYRDAGTDIYEFINGVQCNNSSNSGLYLQNSSDAGQIGAVANGSILMCAYDSDNRKLWYGIDGTWHNSGDPANGTNETIGAAEFTAGKTYFPFSQSHNSSGTASSDTNFGNGYFGTTAVSSAGTNASNNGIFEYDVPTGFTALSTKGLNL
jgi:hypothetical protein